MCLLQQGANTLYKLLQRLDSSIPPQSGDLASDGVVIPVYGPFDRVTLGLQLREWGSEFPSILLLACSKLSLNAFVKHVEESSLVQELLTTEVGASMTRHAAAHHLVQAFLQQQLQSLGHEGGGDGVGGGDIARGRGGYDHGGGDDLTPLGQDTHPLFRATVQRFLQGEREGEGQGQGEGSAASPHIEQLQTLLAQCLQDGVEAGGLVLDAVSSLGLEEEGRRALLLSGKELKQEVLTRIPHGPIFTQVSAQCGSS